MLVLSKKMCCIYFTFSLFLHFFDILYGVVVKVFLKAIMNESS